MVTTTSSELRTAARTAPMRAMPERRARNATTVHTAAMAKTATQARGEGGNHSEPCSIAKGTQNAAAACAV